MDAGDIPVLITNWENSITDAAVDYWVHRSHPDWKPTGAFLRKRSMQSHTHDGSVCERDLPSSLGFTPHHIPCFVQSDTCIRSLWADPAVEYIPPFIIIMPQGGSDTGRSAF